MAATGSRRLIALLTALLLLAACTASETRGAGDDAAPAIPTDDREAAQENAEPDSGGERRGDPADFSTPPDPLPEGEPGDLIRTEELLADPALGDGVRVWRVLYQSESLSEEAIAVSGLVWRPAGPAPEGGFPVVSWAHGTVGAADVCAPSRASQPSPGGLRPLLEAGFVIAATDYEGLGTPGVHPYLVGGSAGRGVLDAARAARLLDGAEAGGQVLVAGASQGGHAALFAGEIAPRYAPDLALAGVVAASAPSDLTTLVDQAEAHPAAFGFALLAIGTWAEIYPDASAEDVLTPEAAARAELVNEVCIGELFGTLVADPIDRLLVADPREIDSWADLVRANSVGAVVPQAPILLVHGDADQVVPVTQSSALRERLCAQGATVDLEVVPGARHGEELGAAFSQVQDWMNARLAGEPSPADCPA